MRKVLHIRSSGGMLGAERVILELSQAASSLGYVSAVAALWDEGDPYPEFLNVAEAAHLQTLAVTVRRSIDFKAIAELRSFIQKESIDIIHCHGYKEDFYGLLAACGRPLLATNHLWKRGTVAATIYSYIDALALRSFDHIVAVSEPVRADMRRVLLPEKKISVIANGIATNIFQDATLVAKRTALRSAWQVTDEEIVLITVSSLTPEKGHTFLLQALPSLLQYPFRLVIVGDGPERERLKLQATNLNIASRIQFLGAQDNIPILLSAADIFVLPSLREGLPMALLEAMAAGKAVVASDVGDVAKAVTAGIGGLIVPAASVEALQQALEKLFVNPSLRKTLAMQATSRVTEHYSAHKMAESYAALYDALLVK